MKLYYTRLAIVCGLLVFGTAALVLGQVAAHSADLDTADAQPVATVELLQTGAVLQLPLLIGAGEPIAAPPSAPELPSGEPAPPAPTAAPGEPTTTLSPSEPALTATVVPEATATTEVPEATATTVVSITATAGVTPTVAVVTPTATITPTATVPSPTLVPVAYKVLVFSKTAGYRHKSIPDGIAMIERLGADNNFAVDATEDASAFTDANLAQYQAVVFMMTTGDVLDADQQAAFERYIGSGGGFVGVHSASDTEYKWPWYGGLVGAYFDQHPNIQPAAIDVEDQAHPSTSHLPTRWERTDEWYNFRSNPRGTVHVLMTVDESSYSGGTMGDDHPLAWCHDYKGGRSWYTAIGHNKADYTEPLFVQHVLGGVEWAMGRLPGDCPVP